MSQLRGRCWTCFQLDAEEEMYGMGRIATEHNTTLCHLRFLYDLLSKARVFVADDELRTEIDQELQESEPFLAKY